MEGIDFYEWSDRVDSRESFLEFLDALVGDWEAREGEWENGTIPGFLDACLRWAEATSTFTGERMVGDAPSWATFARILHAGKFYE